MQKRVLIHHSDNPFLPANMLMDQVFLTGLRASPSLNVTIYSEYLELVRFSEADMLKESIELIKARYSAMDLDLVILTDDFSWDFYAKNASVFHAKAAVICGITEGYLDPKTLPRGVTGNFKRLDIGASLEDILSLHPGVREVVAITGTSPQDKVYSDIARRAFAAYAGRLRTRVLRDYSLEQMGDIVSELPPDSVILYLTVYRDGAGKSYNPRDALVYLSKRAKVPIHGVSDTYLGYGIVGGNLVSFRDFTKDAAATAMAILGGRDPSELPAHPFVNANYFDANELARWGIPDRLLPPNSVIINRTISPWQQYRWQILATLLFIVMETMLVVGLVYSRRQLKLSLSQLGLSEERFRRAISEAPFPIMIQADDGRIEAISRTWTEITGYSHEDIPCLSEWTRLAYGERGGAVKANIDALFTADSRVDEGEFT
ncbi:MAG TPA: PAS domain S-box protein, partial [Rectinemataceae bacterium]|nr:PAS domain S-box protein [Rectinemataceae bacterium]